MKTVLVILGQTSTGKSALAVRLAKKFQGEVISADSRQVYRGIDLGTGKISKGEMKGVPHHLLDIINPKTHFSAAQYQKLAKKKIKEIIKRDKIPIMVGGTGFYIDAVVKNVSLPAVSPDRKLRRRLGTKSARDLFLLLKNLDSKRAKSIDQKNKVRLIRAIEIVRYLGKVPPLRTNEPPNYKFIKIGVRVPEKILKRRIKLRLKNRVRSGMAIELYELKRRGVPWRRFHELGFDQKYTALYLQGKIDNKEMLKKLFQKNWQYAKRQMTWFKRPARHADASHAGGDEEIKWFDAREYRKIVEYIKRKI